MKKDHFDIERNVKEIITKNRMPIHDWYGSHVKIGAMGDTHIGSLYERNDFLRDLYKIFKKEGIHHVYHTGDLTDGDKMYRGQEYELYAIGAEQQLKATKKNYPSYQDITTFFITGNHDLSYQRSNGIDIGEHIDREDLVYLGQEEADIMVGGKNKAILRLVHPSKGTAYALSYHTQKYIESLSGGKKPHVLLVGHYHKAEYLPCYRNVFAVQTGTLQSQTSFMRRKNLAAHIGGWILDFHINKFGITQMNAKFIPYYEK